MKRLILGLLALIIVGVAILTISYYSADLPSAQVTGEMTYADFLSDGSSITGKAPKYVFIQKDGRTIRIPTIFLDDLNEMCEVFIKAPDGTLRSFFWERTDGLQ